jgi:UDP-2,4-diacetamido-2,4,6-trideoxy-beta-L-altropyranose hydrolase
MKFEVACLGRPAILLAVADDQLDVAPVYARTGAADYLGDGRTANPDGIRSAVAGLLADAPRRAAMAATAVGLVDGEGADRIALAILDLIAGGS